MTETKYQQIANDIRSKIISDEYVLGAVIPPELQLQKDYGVSRHTVREAIALLVNEGYLRKEKGSGTYVDNAYLSSTSTNRKTIGVITTYLSDYIFPSIIRGIEQGLREKGYSLLLASTNNDPQQERECLEMMLSNGVQGLIVEPTKSNQYNPNLALYLLFKEKGIPIVMINAYYEELDTPHICVDDAQSGFLATKYLMERNHEHIALITKTDDLQGKYRMKGFIKAYEEMRLKLMPENIFTYTTDLKNEIADQVVQKLIQPENLMTGIVCYNDEIAQRLIQSVNNLGFAVPDDFSIIGNDDSYLSTTGEIGLTTLTHPKEKMGLDAANWIIKAVETAKQQANIYYEPHIVERYSVKVI